MKRLICAFMAAVSLAGTAFPSLAQGRVDFINTASTLVTNGVTGEPIFGTNAFLFGLYVGSAGSQASDLTLLALATNATAASSSVPAAGRFFRGTTVIPNTDGVTPVALQVRGWSLSGGASYEEAYAVGLAGDASILVGQSSVAQVIPSTGTLPVTPLFSPLGPLTGFTLYPVPEPSTVALALLAALMMFCRVSPTRQRPPQP